MLHQTDNNLIFSDKKDLSQLYNFDLQVGKIVEQFQATNDKQFQKMRHLTNVVKNGQSDSHDTFVGIADKAIFTLDPRIGKKEKMAAEKTYKTNP